MKENDKTKEQLIEELSVLKKRIGELEKSEKERNETEKALRESEEKYRTIFENVNNTIIYLNKYGTIIDANNREKTFGRSPEEVIGKNFRKLGFFKAKDLPKILKLFGEVITEGISVDQMEFVINHKDGRKIPIEASTKLVRKNGKIQGFVCIISDITERKRAEEEKKRLQAQLIQSEKMAGIGTLASGIAHEFNNLLQIMSGHVQIANRTKEPEDMKAAFDNVLSTTERTAKIIQDLLSFSRAEETKKEQSSIIELIESVLSLTENQLKKNNIKVVRQYGKTFRLWINKGEMQQVFLNIVTNARDAMLRKGGRLVIRTWQERGLINVSFHDTGRGMREEELGRVFEPFYTTKGALGGDSNISGTGLGLFVSYGIMKRHGGEIEVESKRGKGTTFTISLPLKGRRGVRSQK
jgi:PAS domain S-box-containing protein